MMLFTALDAYGNAIDWLWAGSPDEAMERLRRRVPNMVSMIRSR